ncbi:MAG TPA: zinc ribbon domain-containing protein [Longimicrobiales bacterium]
MPIYEYVCRGCGNEFELRLGYEERLGAHACPACGSKDTLLRISAATVVGAPSRGAGSGGGACCGGACGCGHAA